MEHAMNKVKGYVSKRDLFFVDPREIKVVYNPRTVFEGIDELMTSIIELGVLTPLEVRKNKDNELELIAGERRLRATLKAIELGNDILSVSCQFIKGNTNEADLLVRALTENTGQPLNAVDEANSYKKLMAWGWDVKKIATFIGKSAPYVYKRLDFCAAGPELTQAIVNKDVTITEAMGVIKETDGSLQHQTEKIQEVKQEKIQKKEQKELIKEEIYDQKVLDYIKYKKELSLATRKLNSSFKIKNETIDFQRVKNEAMDLLGLLEEIVDYGEEE